MEDCIHNFFSRHNLSSRKCNKLSLKYIEEVHFKDLLRARPSGIMPAYKQATVSVLAWDIFCWMLFCLYKSGYFCGLQVFRVACAPNWLCITAPCAQADPLIILMTFHLDWSTHNSEFIIYNYQKKNLSFRFDDKYWAKTFFFFFGLNYHSIEICLNPGKDSPYCLWQIYTEWLNSIVI